jgi:anti-sigma regulatory factor (Ser/Thr protein kinase)
MLRRPFNFRCNLSDLPRKFEFLDEIREFVGKIAHAYGGFGDKDVYNIQLATDEAASNIIEHAYDGVSDGLLELSCGMENEAITIILIDHGEPFDPSAIVPAGSEGRSLRPQNRGTGHLSHAQIDG